MIRNDTVQQKSNVD